MGRPKLKQLPVFNPDEESEHFADTADLSEHDFSAFVPMDLEELLDLSMSVPHDLVETLEAKAAERGMHATAWRARCLDKPLPHNPVWSRIGI